MLTLAVLTFRRPDDLKAVLPLVVAQAIDVEGLGVEAEVLVVDNSPEASARAIVETTVAGDQVAASRPAPRVRYVHEPRPGIAAARNRALDEGSGSRLLVFLDDDERPSPGWLASLVDLQRRQDAAAVVGPVVSEFAHEPEPWIVAGRFFERRRPATGTAVEVAATNNLLLDLDRVRAWGLTFDESLGALGGEDTLFTRSIHARGGRMVWCAEAVVTDVVPPARLTRSWVVRRAYSSGNAWSVTTLMLAAHGGVALRPRLHLGLRLRLLFRLRLRLRLSGVGLVRVAGGVARIVVGAVTRSLGQRARGVRTLARGAGMVAGAWGVRYAEYRR